MKLKWSKANAKTERLNESCWQIAKYLDDGRKVYSLDLLSGHSCPFAEKCLSKAVETDGKRAIKDGPKTTCTISESTILTCCVNTKGQLRECSLC